MNPLVLLMLPDAGAGIAAAGFSLSILSRATTIFAAAFVSQAPLPRPSSDRRG
jgi:hypothetical protein